MSNDVSLGRFLAAVTKSIEKDGYLNRQEAQAKGGVATSKKALDLIDGITDSEAAQTQGIQDWVCNQKGRSEYFAKGATTFERESIPLDQIGFVASLVVAFQRANLKALSSSTPMPAGSGFGWVGIEGEGFVKRLTLVKVGEWQQGKYEFGSGFTRHELRDREGNEYTWFGSAISPWVDKQGGGAG